MGVARSQPIPITTAHNLSDFDCGRESLNNWLKQRALKNAMLNASRTYVVCDEDRVLGYYGLATGSIEQNDAPGRIKRNMPSPIPIMILGRLAVDLKYQGLKIGKGLLKDAVLRTLSVSQQVGLAGILVHAADDSACYFYKAHGFIECPNSPTTLILPISKL